jgi:hypothetical protein
LNFKSKVEQHTKIVVFCCVYGIFKYQLRKENSMKNKILLTAGTAAKLTMNVGIGLILFGMIASMATALHGLITSSQIISASMYYESIAPSWPIKTSLVGLVVSTFGMGLYTLSRLNNLNPSSTKAI